MIRKIKNLFKLYDLLTKKEISIDLGMFNPEKGKWYGTNMVSKRTDDGEIVLDHLTVYQVKTKTKQEKIEKDLNKYYKLI